MRKFEKISYKQFEKDFGEFDNVELMYSELIMPSRGTTTSAGYDICAPHDFILKPGQIIKMHTGTKATMEDDEFLMIFVRSSMGFKYNIRLCNQVGIIDADYYNNDDNEGHICLAMQNEGIKDFVVKTGDRVAQAIFTKYLTVSNEEEITTKRTGGIGSTNIGGNNNE